MIGQLAQSNSQFVRQIKSLRDQSASLSDDDLKSAAVELRYRARSGESFLSLMPQAFAYALQAIHRTRGFHLHDVQILGGVTMVRQGIAEMKTGEGKTLTAVQPSFLYSLAGKGVHVVTVNDYLASRDAEELTPIYNLLGCETGCITTDMNPETRRQAYAKDITYGTSKEIGFDFLKDRLKVGAEEIDEARRNLFITGSEEELVQRSQFCAIVDEADSVLIDDARTPLLIGAPMPESPQKVNLFRWAARAIHKLVPQDDFILKAKQRQVFLTDPGCRKVMLLGKPALMEAIDAEAIYDNVERALEAKLFYQLDRHYTIHEEEVVIVDESTGRMMPGRKWQNGLHQAVEAKEGLPITAPTTDAARITVQSYFMRYQHLCGMTGTAWNARKEFRKTYRMKVQQIPTNKTTKRDKYSPRIFTTRLAKYEAIAIEIDQLLKAGRAVLIGTPSVGASEQLAAILTEMKISHLILNARYHKEEADIVKDAGQPGAVTIATNMAGRGTDILLHDSVRNAGGLHVIATEMHSSIRIDRQLIGRCSRQGDPGSYQFFLSLEDELLSNLPQNKIERWRNKARPDAKGELPQNWLRCFTSTQRFLEKQHYKQRKDLLKREQKQMQTYRRIGLNPFLEAMED